MTAMQLVNHLGPDAAHRALRDDVRAGLSTTPKSIPPKWFYDDTGSALFTRITRLPEYYPTRIETAILAARSALIAELTGADTLVELGSGNGEKTRLLLDALHDGEELRRYIPFDVDAAMLVTAGAGIAADYPGLDVTAVCGDFEHHLTAIPAGGRRLFAFLGSTIGNLTPGPRAEFLSALATVMAPGDHLLLGADLVKDPDRLVAAYDDADGVTAEFNRNVLAVINTELGADFEPQAYAHVARWNLQTESIEMWLRADRPQRVRITELDLVIDIAGGEAMLTEVSAKFRPDGIAGELTAAGLRPVEFWTDSDGDFGLALATK